MTWNTENDFRRYSSDKMPNMNCYPSRKGVWHRSIKRGDQIRYPRNIMSLQLFILHLKILKVCRYHLNKEVHCDFDQTAVFMFRSGIAYSVTEFFCIPRRQELFESLLISVTKKKNPNCFQK